MLLPNPPRPPPAATSPRHSLMGQIISLIATLPKLNLEPLWDTAFPFGSSTLFSLKNRPSSPLSQGFRSPTIRFRAISAWGSKTLNLKPESSAEVLNTTMSTCAGENVYTLYRHIPYTIKQKLDTLYYFSIVYILHTALQILYRLCTNIV